MGREAGLWSRLFRVSARVVVARVGTGWAGSKRSEEDAIPVGGQTRIAPAGPQVMELRSRKRSSRKRALFKVRNQFVYLDAERVNESFFLSYVNETICGLG